MAITRHRQTIDDIELKVPVKYFYLGGVALQAGCLALCFLTGIIFRFEEVNKTRCPVKNWIPSISAVTGILPQAYFWRTCSALNSSLITGTAFIYYIHYTNRMHLIPSPKVSLFKRLLRLNFWLRTLLCISYLMATFISNVENDFLHEKMTIVFIVSMLSYVTLNTILFKWTRTKKWSDSERMSYQIKKLLCISGFSSSLIALCFFIQHRFFCIEGAYSWFSASELLIAYSSIIYDVTGYFDFKELSFVVGDVLSNESNSSTVSTKPQHRLGWASSHPRRHGSHPSDR